MKGGRSKQSAWVSVPIGGVGRGGGTCLFFGWICAARDSKLVTRSNKISLKIDTSF